MMQRANPWFLLTFLLACPAPGTAAVSAPSSNCPHVQVLESHETDQIHWEHDGGLLSDNSRLMDPRPNQLEALGEALDMMPEILCNAVQKVAFIYRPPEEGRTTVVDAWTKSNDRQNLVYLNTWDELPWNQNNISGDESVKAAAKQRMIHESTHCAIRMIQSQQMASPVGLLQERPDESLWPASARNLAKEAIRTNRLNVGVLREWQRMHDAFASASMATPYWGGDWPTMNNNMTADHIVAAGFTSAYGGDNAMEDIAELTSWAIVRGAAEDPEDAACRIMNRRAGSSISSDDAAIFTKLNFVRSLGFIDDSHYQGCVGSLEIEAPGPGFYSYVDGSLNRSYSGNPRAGVGRGDGADAELLIANITADGTASTSSGSFPATINLQLNVTPTIEDIAPADVSYPRGVYFVGFRHSKYNRLQITNRGDGKLIMDVGQGVALVSRASSDGIIGSVAVQRIFNYSGGLLSAVAGDEPVSEPTKITFMYKPGEQTNGD